MRRVLHEFFKVNFCNERMVVKLSDCNNENAVQLLTPYSRQRAGRSTLRGLLRHSIRFLTVF
jgi:hypothetical protein